MHHGRIEDSRGGAEALAWGTSYELEAAAEVSDAVSGLALDWSKCYDRLNLDCLQKVLNRAGVPRKIALSGRHC